MNVEDIHEVSRKAIEFFDNKCYFCRTDEDLTIHYTFSFRNYSFLRLNEEIGLCLCRSCHKKLHKTYRDPSVADCLKFKQEKY